MNEQKVFVFDEEQKVAVLEKIEKSIASVQDLRISPFLPIDRVSKNSTTYKMFVKNRNILVRETERGKIEIRNRLLTMKHKEIFDAIMSIAKDKNIKFIRGERVPIYFSFYELVKKLGLANPSGRTIRELHEKIKEIADTRLSFSTKNGDKEDNFGIIEDIKFSESKKSFGIILTNTFVKNFSSQLTINYERVLPGIIEIGGEGSGLVKAIIYFFLSHRAGESKEGRKEIVKYSLEKILIEVGYPQDSKRSIQLARSIVKKHMSDFEKFSIFYMPESRIFEYYGLGEKVTFIPALPGIAGSGKE